jgi:inorganic pyrophosphatase
VNYNTDKKILKGVIVGGLMMHDEKGADEKIFVVPEDEFESFMNMSSQQKTKIHNDICWFFSNYKLFDIGKWSRVECLMDCQEAIYTYRQAKRQFADKQISPV